MVGGSPDRMSGGLFTRAVARELGHPLAAAQAEAIQNRHGVIFMEVLPTRRPVAGALGLLRAVRAMNVPHAIATSGRRPEIDASLEALEIPPTTVVVESLERTAAWSTGEPPETYPSAV
jgi:beta-phosphoglucomutase-like phosphatase (HAD superfamily)